MQKELRRLAIGTPPAPAWRAATATTAAESNVDVRRRIEQTRVRLSGPHDLDFEGLHRLLPARRVGVFALGRVDAAGTFRVERVGRAHNDLREELRALIGCGNQFKYALADSARAAFDQECELFHRLRPPGNFIHPGRPAWADWTCHWCTQLHL